MAETPKKDDTRPLVDRLVSDPRNPPDLTMLQGWLGVSSEDKYRRLYLDPELSQSLEIPEDAIVHTQDIPVDVNPLGGSWVWVKAEAAVKQGPGLERLYARFLRGQIQQDFFATGGGGGLGTGTVGAPAIGAVTSPILCPPQTIFNCPTRQVWCRPSVFTICPSQLTICPTRPIICQVTAPPFQSVAVACLTRVCPSAVDACPSAPGGCWELTTVVQTTVVQTPVLQTPVVQPGLGQFGVEGGLGFDPGAGGGGFVGAPATSSPACQFTPVTSTPACQVAPGTHLVLCQPSIVPQTCQITRIGACLTRLFICRTVFSPWCPPTTPLAGCPPRTLWGPGCPIPTLPPGCPQPSLPPGCPSGFVCGEFGGATTVINPGIQGAGGFDPSGGMGFDPNAGMDPTGGAGGFVGAPASAAPACLLPVSQIVICRPTIIPQTCITRTSPFCPTRPILCRTIGTPWCPPWTVLPPVCPIRTVPPGCPILSAPPGCPSGFVCGEFGGATTVINPGIQGAGGFDPSGGAGFDPNAGMDPAGGGMVGAAMPTGWPACRTRVPACWPTIPSHCPQLCWV